MDLLFLISRVSAFSHSTSAGFKSRNSRVCGLRWNTLLWNIKSTSAGTKNLSGPTFWQTINIFVSFKFCADCEGTMFESDSSMPEIGLISPISISDDSTSAWVTISHHLWDCLSQSYQSALSLPGLTPLATRQTLQCCFPLQACEKAEQPEKTSECLADILKCKQP